MASKGWRRLQLSLPLFLLCFEFSVPSIKRNFIKSDRVTGELNNKIWTFAYKPDARSGNLQHKNFPWEFWLQSEAGKHLSHLYKSKTIFPQTKTNQKVLEAIRKLKGLTILFIRWTVRFLHNSWSLWLQPPKNNFCAALQKALLVDSLLGDQNPHVALCLKRCSYYPHISFTFKKAIAVQVKKSDDHSSSVPI